MIQHSIKIFAIYYLQNRTNNKQKHFWYNLSMIPDRISAFSPAILTLGAGILSHCALVKLLKVLRVRILRPFTSTQLFFFRTRTSRHRWRRRVPVQYRHVFQFLPDSVVHFDIIVLATAIPWIEQVGINVFYITLRLGSAFVFFRFVQFRTQGAANPWSTADGRGFDALRRVHGTFGEHQYWSTEAFRLVERIAENFAFCEANYRGEKIFPEFVWEKFNGIEVLINGFLKIKKYNDKIWDG